MTFYAYKRKCFTFRKLLLGILASIFFSFTPSAQATRLEGENNFGWIIKKTDEGQSGRIEFRYRETSSPPKLVFTFE